MIPIRTEGEDISKDELERLIKSLEKNLQKTSSIGLMNINNRLKLKFGEIYGLEIDSEINEGTTVKIKIPILRDEVKNV